MRFGGGQQTVLRMRNDVRRRAPALVVAHFAAHELLDGGVALDAIAGRQVAVDGGIHRAQLGAPLELTSSLLPFRLQLLAVAAPAACVSDVCDSTIRLRERQST